MVDHDLLKEYRFQRQANSLGWRLSTPAKALQAARKSLNDKYGRRPESYGWNPPFAAFGSKAMRWIEKPAACGLRFVGYADELAGLKHNGWYVDNDQSESIRGVVFQLPGRDGKPLFVAGYEDWNNGHADNGGPVCLDFGDTIEGEAPEYVKPHDEWSGHWTWTDNPAEHNGARTAARWADQIAERMAESERNYQAAWQAGNRFADLGQEMADNRENVKALLAERKAARGNGESYPTICQTIRRAVSESLGDIENARKERRKLAAGDFVSEWLPGFYSGDSGLRAAFNEGAGESVFPA